MGLSNIVTDWNKELQRATERVTEIAIAVIRKNGNKFCIYSKTGKNLGCYPTKKQAQDRLSQIEMHKHIKKGEKK